MAGSSCCGFFSCSGSDELLIMLITACILDASHEAELCSVGDGVSGE